MTYIRVDDSMVFAGDSDRPLTVAERERLNGSILRNSRRQYNDDGSEWTLKQLSLKKQAQTFAQRWCEKMAEGNNPLWLKIGYDYENWVVIEGSSFGQPLNPIQELVLDWKTFEMHNALDQVQQPEKISRKTLKNWEKAITKIALHNLKK